MYSMILVWFLYVKDITEEVPENNYPHSYLQASELLCDINSVKTHVNQSDFFEKLGFQDKIFSKDTILFIPSKVLGDFKANKVK